MSFDPVIIIPGIGQSKLFIADENGAKVKDAWPFALDEKKLLSDFKGSLMSMLLFKKDAGFSDKVAKVVDDITAPLSLREDGSKKYNVRPVSYKRSVAECSADEKNYIYKMTPFEELGEKIGEDKLFFFAYDPFGDVYDTAASLDEFVAFVREKTGCEKVSLVSISIGGVVMKAYLQKFASKHEVGKILNIVSVLDGTSVVADLFENKLTVDDPSSLLASLGGKAAALASSVKMLPADIIHTAVTKAFNTAVNNLLYNCTTMWGAVPHERFDEIYRARFSDGGNDVLSSKVKSLHDYVLAENVENIPFYLICGYGKKLIPVVASADTSSDSVVDVASASLGGKAENAQASVDVSSCAFPDRTWFFKEQAHSAIAYNDVALSLAVKILTDEITDVHTDASYPQFNGSRNIKALKYTLVPNARKKTETADEGMKNELMQCLGEYDALLKDTVIENDDKVKLLEEKFNHILNSVKE